MSKAGLAEPSDRTSCPLSALTSGALAVLKRRRRKDARPAELAAAALELFITKGFAATRLEEIAARAGVGKGTIYLYFESKEALFKAAVDAAMTPTIEAAEALISRHDMTARQRLEAFVSGWWAMVAGTPISGLPKLMVAESGNFPEFAQWHYENIIRRALRVISGIIDAGVASGEFRATPSDMTSRIVLSPLFTIIIWTHTFKHIIPDLPDPKTYLHQALDLLVNGLTADHAESTHRDTPR